MKNTIILLSVLLAVAIITILVLSWHYINTKDAFLINEKKMSDLNEEIIQLKQKSSELNDQFRENIRYFNELKIAKNRLSELETEISSKKMMVTELQERLKSSQSRFTQLEDEIIKHKNEVDSLQRRLSNFERQSVESEALADKMRSTYETTISGLNKEIKKCKDENKELFLRISELQGEKGQLKIRMEQLQSTHNAIVLELKNQIQNKEVTISELEDKLSITFVDRVLFQFGKATITREGGELLTKVGNILKNLQDRRIRVIGHTDNIPIMAEYRYKFPSNWELSAARAAAVVRHFQKEIGLNPKTLEAVGRSFYEPIASNETEKGRAKNRRVEIIIVPRRN